jgi:HD-GYP domain-containing protein (c-di-GMP phosphodiesterase class II)
MPVITQRYTLAQLEPGMELGQHVLNSHGKILLAEGIILNETLLQRLTKLGIEEVTIKENAPFKNNLITLDETKLQLLNQAVAQIKDSFKVIERYGKVPFNIFKSVANNNIWPLVLSHSAINYLNIDHAKDNYLYVHSVNVGLLSGLIGKWSGYSNDEISALILTGLLHDIGKTQIPQEILNKTEKLSKKEMEVIKLHATYSFSLLSKNSSIPTDVKFGILQHHERLDGSGYPGHFKAAKIHRYARIVAIADMYDAMTSERIHCHKSNPFIVVDELVKDMYSKLDARLCTTFLTQFSNFIIGNIVQLADGREGEIIYTGHFLNFSLVVQMTDGECVSISDLHSITKLQSFSATSSKDV